MFTAKWGFCLATLQAIKWMYQRPLSRLESLKGLSQVLRLGALLAVVKMHVLPLNGSS